MTAQLWAIGLVILASLFGGAGPVYLKKSTRTLRIHYSAIYNKDLIKGLLFFTVATPIFIIALQGGEVSTLYPIASTSYIWTLILGHHILEEKITRKKITGITLIMIGVAMLSFGI